MMGGLSQRKMRTPQNRHLKDGKDPPHFFLSCHLNWTLANGWKGAAWENNSWEVLALFALALRDT